MNENRENESVRVMELCKSELVRGIYPKRRSRSKNDHESQLGEKHGKTGCWVEYVHRKCALFVQQTVSVFYLTKVLWREFGFYLAKTIHIIALFKPRR